MPLTWTIEYTATARCRIRELDKQMARRIVDTMSERVAVLENPRNPGKALTGPMGEFWRYRVENTVWSATFRTLFCVSWSRGSVVATGCTGKRVTWP